MKKKILFIIALLVLIASSKFTKAQIVCDSAVLLTQSPVCSYYHQIVPAGNTEYWYKFVADSSDVNVSTMQYGLPGMQQSLIELYSYSGTCDSLTQMGQHTQTLGITGLNYGQTYYIRVYQYNMTDFGICVAKLSLPTMLCLSPNSNYCVFHCTDGSENGGSPTWYNYCDALYAGCIGDKIDFELVHYHSTSNTTYNWTFLGGSCNGGPFTETSPTIHNCTYSTPGTYYVYVTVFDGDLGYDISEILIEIIILDPDAEFSYIQPGCHSIEITPIYPSSYTGYSIDWGDGTFAPFSWYHNYTEYGTYTISATATATSSEGVLCSSNTYNQTITIAPIPEFNYSNICEDAVASFNDISTCTFDITQWQWDYGDGSQTETYTSSTNPTHSFATYGTYNVTLTLIDSNGNPYTITHVFTVYPLPNAPVITGNNNNCSPAYYTITNYDPVAYTYEYWINSGSEATISTNPFLVDLTAFSGTNTLYFSVKDNITGCTTVTTFTVFDCCEPLEPFYPHYDNETISTSGPINNSTDPITINGNLTIEADVIIDGKTLLMGPESKIIINPSFSLTIINNSILQQGCDRMWDGIYIKDNTAHLNITGSFIYDAINAVVSEQGGVYTISQSTFGRNYKNITVKPYSLPHTGTIQSTHFNGSTLLLDPHINDRTYVGVEITNVNHIQIGTVGNYSMRNFFDNMDFGIKASVTDVDIYNNSFGHIDCSTCSILDFYTPPKGVAIMVEGRKGTTHTVNVGDVNISPSLLQGNSFPQCFMGVHAYFNLNINVKNNTFISSLFGVFVHHNNFITNIRNNTFACSMGAPGFMAIGSAEMTIDNVIDIMNNNIQNYTTGIYARNVFENNVRKLTIGENTISSHLTNNGVIGIMATNVKGTPAWGPNPRPYAYILNNTITFYNPSYSTTNYTGILVQGCEKVNLEQNTISKFGPALSNGTYAMNLNGINVALSPEAILCNNITEKLGCGLRFKGKMPATLTTNEMRKCFYGVQLDNAYIGNQGTTGSTWDNRWTYPGTPPTGWQKVNGVLLALTNWYYRGSISPINPLKPDPFSPSLLPSLFLYNINPPNYIVCGSINPNFDTRFNAIVNNQTNYNINSFANKYLEKKYAFKNLRANPDTLQALAIAQPVYQTFYDSVSTSTIGNFETVIDSVHQGSFAYAALSNNTIVAIDTIDVNQKSVIDVYLKTWANRIFEFTQNQYDSLYQIAMQDETTGGFGVYGARVMLGIEPNFMNILKTTATIENIEPVESKMYPNPAKDKAYFDYYLEEGLQGELNIYNIVGQLLQKYILTANENHIVINTAKLGQGVYLYCLKVNNSIVTNDKFVILK